MFLVLVPKGLSLRLNPEKGGQGGASTAGALAAREPWVHGVVRAAVEHGNTARRTRGLEAPTGRLRGMGEYEGTVPAQGLDQRKRAAGTHSTPAIVLRRRSARKAHAPVTAGTRQTQ